VSCPKEINREKRANANKIDLALLELFSPDGKVVAKHLKAGQVFWSEAVTHSIGYTGKTEGHILAVELKK
jgi:hypothetical protein